MKLIAPAPALRRPVIVTLMAGLLAWTGHAAAPTPHDHVVTMANMSYGKVPSDLKVGDTITWVNRDSVAHTVTARDRSFDWRLNPGQSVQQTLQKDGSFAFYCIYHTAMRGTLKVAAQ